MILRGVNFFLRTVPVTVLLLLGTVSLFAEDADRLFELGESNFTNKIYVAAEKYYGEMVQKFPTHEKATLALLRKGQAGWFIGRELKQSGKLDAAKEKFGAVAQLLLTGQLGAGALGDQYRFWTAQAYFEAGEPAKMSEIVGKLLLEFPASPLRLDASYLDAASWAQRGDFNQVVELLRNPAGAFQQAAATKSLDPVVMQGTLLLAEALLQTKRAAEAEEILVKADRPVAPELDWRRLFLLSQILMETRLSVAVALIDRLQAAAQATANRDFMAETTFLAGELYRRNAEWEPAVAQFSRNLEGPPERRRQATLKIIQIRLQQRRLTEAGSQLSDYLAKFPDDKLRDSVQLLLGELRIQEIFGSIGTNQPPFTETVEVKMKEASEIFDQVISQAKENPIRGRGYLGRGWIAWARGAWVESQKAFQSAATFIPPSIEQAVARFKVGDSWVMQTNQPAALQEYQSLLKDYKDVAQVRAQILDQALYQILRVQIALKDTTAAVATARQILDWFPASYYGDPGVMVSSQYLQKVGEPAQARSILEGGLTNQNAALDPELKLAIARTYFHEGNWAEGGRKLEAWLTEFPDHDLRPRAEFEQCYATSMAGQSEIAFAGFKKFLDRYATHDLAPPANLWIGNYLFERGVQERVPEKLIEAERTYEKIFSQWPTNEIGYRAKLLAAKTAISRSSPNARKHLTDILDKCTFTNILAEACFVYGDWIFSDAKEKDAYGEAIILFDRVPKLLPLDRLTPMAYGRLGDCHQQRGQYPEAREHYTKALNHPAVSAHTRNLCRLALATVELRIWEAAGSTSSEGGDKALLAYAEVYDDRTAGVFLRKEALLSAIRLLRQQSKVEQAIGLCTQMQKELPALSDLLKAEITALKNPK